jgi:hypothetical protein
LGWDRDRFRSGNDDDDDSESGRISHVSCSVDESSDEDEIDQVGFLLMTSIEYTLI